MTVRPFKLCPNRILPVLLLLLAVHPAARAQQTVGLFQNDPGSFEGYTLFSPNNDTTAYLINNDGHLVKSWATAFRPGLAVYLLPNGNLLRAAQIPYQPAFLGARGHGGRIEEYDWDGNLVWSYELSTSQYLAHHDFTRMPNGNTLILAWEYRNLNESIQAGRNPSAITQGNLWSEAVFEIEPTGPDSGTIVWEWHAWDHLVQDFDASKDNFGTVADHPELIDLNENGNQDFLHFNGMDYDPLFDQIVISTREYSEFYILDHSTTSAEAAGHTGGTYGQGGDLLYRWGNPQTYDRGTSTDRILYFQHDAHWIADGKPGARNIMVFNNGSAARGGFSTVEEITLPIDESGFYADPGSGPYDPAAPTWTFIEDPPTDFYSPIISGADRLPNNNTVVIEGTTGRLFEVTSAGDKVWEYVNPIGANGPLNQGDVPTPQGQTDENLVFKGRRYSPDYSAFDGKDVTPMGPLEGFTSPSPVPDGSGGTMPLTASRQTVAGDQIEVQWDTGSCQAAVDYNLLYGRLVDLAAQQLLGAECSIGVSGTHLWQSVPAEDLYFLVVGTDPTGVYESSWGTTSSGEERALTRASFECGVTTKSLVLTCP